MQVEALLLPLDLHGFACRRQLSKLCQWSTAYLNAVPEVARHRWRPHEDPLQDTVRTLLHTCSSTRLDMLLDTAHSVKTRFKTHCCGSFLAAPLLTGFGGQQWGQVLVRTS